MTNTNGNLDGAIIELRDAALEYGAAFNKDGAQTTHVNIRIDAHTRLTAAAHSYFAHYVAIAKAKR